MVPLAAPGLYFVSVREKPSAETPFQTVRVYLKRLPSGAYRVTVLSPSLPRPVFRMYPAECSEVEAVARAVGRALSLGDAEAEQECHRRDETCLNPVATCANDVPEDKGHQNCGNSSHLSSPFPRCEQQPADEQRYAHHAETAPVELVAHRGNEVMQHWLVPAPVGCSTHNADNNASPSPPRIRLSQEKQKVETATEGTKRYSPLTAEQRATEIATPHRRPPLRLRVLWQGLL